MTENVRLARNDATTPFTARSLEMALVRRARYRNGPPNATAQSKPPSWHVLQFLPWILDPHTVLWPPTGMGHRTCAPFVLRAHADGPVLASCHDLPRLENGAVSLRRGWPTRDRIDACREDVARRIQAALRPPPSASHRLSLRPMRIAWRTLHACASYHQRNALRGPTAAALLPLILARIRDSLDTLRDHAGTPERAQALAHGILLAQQHADIDACTLADLLDATPAGKRIRQWAERLPLAFALALDTGTWRDPIRTLVIEGAGDHHTLAPMRHALEDAAVARHGVIGARRLRAIAATDATWTQRLRRTHNDTIPGQTRLSPFAVARAAERTGQCAPRPELAAVVGHATRLRTPCETPGDVAALQRALKPWVEQVLDGSESISSNHGPHTTRRKGRTRRTPPTPLERDRRRYGPKLRPTARRTALAQITLIQTLDRAERDLRKRAALAWNLDAHAIDTYFRDQTGQTIWPRYVRTLQRWTEQGRQRLEAAIDQLILARRCAISWTSAAPASPGQGWRFEPLASYGALIDTAQTMDNCTDTMLESMLRLEPISHLYLLTAPDGSRSQALLIHTRRGWKLAQIEAPSRAPAPKTHRTMGRAIARWLQHRRTAAPWHDMVDQATREGASAQRRHVHQQLMPLAGDAGELDPELRDVVRNALRAALPEFATWCEQRPDDANPIAETTTPDTAQDRTPPIPRRDNSPDSSSP